MSQQTRLGTHATTVRYENGATIVRYHQTDILKFNEDKIILNTGGWNTTTTKKRLNQASAQFGLNYHVYQKNYDWLVEYKGRVIIWIEPILILDRKEV